jgi:hypothetical protein
MQQTLKVLSSGLGVQSWTLMFKSAMGELPKLDVIIHADTSWEGEATHAYAKKYLPIIQATGIDYVTLSSLSTRHPERHKTNLLVPAIVQNKSGGLGRLNRQCTTRWKLDPVRQAIRQELQLKGLKPKPEAVELWIGISWDEATRARSSDVKYIAHRYPLLEKATRMTRQQCKDWLTANGFDIPPKSSCTHCTYHDNRTWEAQKREGGTDWQRSVQFDRAIRNKGGRYGLLYIHRSGKPLEQAVRIPEDEGYTQPGLFDTLDKDGSGEEIACEVTANCWN